MKKNFKLYLAILIIVFAAIGTCYLVYFYKPAQKAENKPTETKQVEDIRDFDFEKILPSDPNKINSFTTDIKYMDLTGDGKEEAVISRVVGMQAQQIYIYQLISDTPQLLFVSDRGLKLIDFDIDKSRIIERSPNPESDVNKGKSTSEFDYDITTYIFWYNGYFAEMGSDIREQY